MREKADTPRLGVGVGTRLGGGLAPDPGVLYAQAQPCLPSPGLPFILGQKGTADPVPKLL